MSKLKIIYTNERVRSVHRYEVVLLRRTEPTSTAPEKICWKGGMSGKIIFTYQSHGLYLDISSPGEGRHLEGRPGWLVMVEELGVDLVDLCELFDILHEDGGLDDVLVPTTSRLQDLSYVPERLLGLGQSSSLHHGSSLLHAELTGDVQGAVHHDGLVVRPDGGRSAGAVDQLPAEGAAHRGTVHPGERAAD